MFTLSRNVIGHLGAVTLQMRQQCHAQRHVGIMRQSKKTLLDRIIILKLV